MKPYELLDRLIYITKEASVEPHFNSELPEDRLIPLIAFADSIATAGQNIDGLREMAALYLAGFEAGHNYALKYGSLVEHAGQPVP